MKHSQWAINLIMALIMILLAFSSCSNNENLTKNNKQQIGAYVYFDTQKVLHTKRLCISGMKITNAKGRSYYKSIQFIDTTDIMPSHLKRLCPCCVKDEHYEQLKIIATYHNNLYN